MGHRDHQKAKHAQQLRRRRHVRKRIRGTAERPRLSVFRSSKHIYAQIIDDDQGVTLAAVSSLAPEVRDQLPHTVEGKLPYGGNKQAAALVGKHLAEVAKARGITRVAFDRGHYRYHGRVAALAQAAREGGLQF